MFLAVLVGAVLRNLENSVSPDTLQITVVPISDLDRPTRSILAYFIIHVTRTRRPKQLLFASDNAVPIIGVGPTGHFWRGLDRFYPKNMGQRQKMNSRTNMIKQDETRKLDYVDCGKSLKNLYLHLYCPFIINIC